MKVVLLVDVRDESGDSNLFIPAGTLVNVASTEDGNPANYIFEYNGITFPLDMNEWKWEENPF